MKDSWRAGKSWALPNGNFYTTVDVGGKSTFCTCLGPGARSRRTRARLSPRFPTRTLSFVHPWDWAVDPTRSNTLTGPLRYDFNDGAKLVGRERVRPEYYAEAVVADHWVKGPHHFWIEVSTNLMLREWQPFNGLQVKSPPLPCPILSTHVEGGRGFARFCLRRTSTGTLRHRTLLSSTSRRSATRACCILMSRAKHPHLPVLSNKCRWNVTWFRVQCSW